MTIVIADPVVESFTKQSEYVIRIQNRINTSSFVTTLVYVEASTPDRHIHQWPSLSRVAVSQNGSQLYPSLLVAAYSPIEHKSRIYCGLSLGN